MRRRVRRKSTYSGLVVPGKRRRARVIVKLVSIKKRKRTKKSYKSKGNPLDKIASQVSKIPVIGSLM